MSSTAQDYQSRQANTAVAMPRVRVEPVNLDQMNEVAAQERDQGSAAQANLEYLRGHAEARQQTGGWRQEAVESNFDQAQSNELTKQADSGVNRAEYHPAMAAQPGQMVESNQPIHNHTLFEAPDTQPALADFRLSPSEVVGEVQDVTSYPEGHWMRQEMNTGSETAAEAVQDKLEEVYAGEDGARAEALAEVKEKVSQQYNPSHPEATHKDSLGGELLRLFWPGGLSSAEAACAIVDERAKGMILDEAA